MELIVKYESFGAKGDGIANDFAAIKAAHDYANEKGLPVEGCAGKTYRLGDNGKESAIIKTDTLWVGCAFIIDDSEIMPDDPARTTPLFIVRGDKKKIPLDIKSLALDQENIGVKVGFKALVHVVNDNQRRYKRCGLNQDNGDSQREILIVDADGNVDPSTPVSWDYEQVTKAEAISIDEKPLVINGGHFIRWANNAPNEYTYYKRGIVVERSNVKIKNIENNMIKQGPTRAPYAGFIEAAFVSNLVLENCIFHAHTHYYRQDPGGKNLLGSYEIQFYASNGIVLKNCYQPNMYEEDQATVVFKGEMGSNYCRNFLVDGCHLSSFDSHKASGNITIINSEIEHINCIGAGHVHIENTVIHMGPKPEIMTLRGDYGCIWRGTAYLKDLTLVSPRANQDFSIMAGYGEWNNWDFGYETCMPHTVTLCDIRTSDGRPLYIFARYIENYGDVSAPVLENGEKNLNPYKAVEKVIVESNKYNIPIIINDSPIFKDTVVVEK